jgi:hypothetical protein
VRVWWLDNHGFNPELVYRAPAEVEAEYYAEQDPVLVTAVQGKQQERNPGRFRVSLNRGSISTQKERRWTSVGDKDFPFG